MSATEHETGPCHPLLYEIESLRQQLKTQQDAANHWFTEANNSHNRCVKLEQQIADLKKDYANGTATQHRLYLNSQQKLDESQAREKVLFSHLNNIFKNCVGWAGQTREALNEVREVLAMPFDSTALDSAIRQAKREALLEAEKKFIDQADMEATASVRRIAFLNCSELLRSMADELKGGDK